MNLYLCLLQCLKCGKKELWKEPCSVGSVCGVVAHSIDELGCRPLNKHSFQREVGKYGSQPAKPSLGQEGSAVPRCGVQEAKPSCHTPVFWFSWGFGSGEATKAQSCKAQLSKVVLSASPESPTLTHLPRGKGKVEECRRE